MIILNLILLISIGVSYVGLWRYTLDPQMLWFGMNEMGLAIKVMIMPIILACISFVYLLVYVYKLDDSNTDLENTLTFMYTFALLWAPLLYLSIERWNVLKYAVILILLGVTISSTVFLSLLVKENETSPVAIFASCCILFQSLIDSIVWSYFYLKNL